MKLANLCGFFAELRPAPVTMGDPDLQASLRLSSAYW